MERSSKKIAVLGKGRGYGAIVELVLSVSCYAEDTCYDIEMEFTYYFAEAAQLEKTTQNLISLWTEGAKKTSIRLHALECENAKKKKQKQRHPDDFGSTSAPRHSEQDACCTIEVYRFLAEMVSE